MLSGQTSNKERLLAQIIRNGPLHRADLARSLEVSRTTVTNLSQALVESHVLIQEDLQGIKARLYIPQTVGVMVSVVFSIRHTALLITALDGRELAHNVDVCVPDERGSKRFEVAKESLTRLLETLNMPKIRAMHIAVNTQVDTRSGDVLGAQTSTMWQGINLVRGFGEFAPDAPILIENTARLVGLMQSRLQAPCSGGSENSSRISSRESSSRYLHKNVWENVIYVHLSYGVTLGQVIDGQIAHGSRGGAGEIGHVSIDPHGVPCGCGNKGCLAQYVGEEAVLRRIQAIQGISLSVEELIAACSNQRDEFLAHAAKMIFTDVGEILGQALVMVCHILDPEVILIGGKLALSDPFIDAVKRVVKQRALPLNSKDLGIYPVREPFDTLKVACAGIEVLRGDEDVMRRCVRDILEG